MTDVDEAEDPIPRSGFDSAGRGATSSIWLESWIASTSLLALLRARRCLRSGGRRSRSPMLSRGRRRWWYDSRWLDSWHSFYKRTSACRGYCDPPSIPTIPVQISKGLKKNPLYGFYFLLVSSLFTFAFADADPARYYTTLPFAQVLSYIAFMCL